jgi:hypothetical protein
MKAVVDFLVIPALLGCAFIAYAGFRIEACLLAFVVITVASWRFWDSSREKHLLRGSSGHDCPDHPDSICGQTSDDFGAEGDA